MSDDVDRARRSLRGGAGLAACVALTFGCTRHATDNANSSGPNEGVPLDEVNKMAALPGPFALRCALRAGSPAIRGADAGLMAAVIPVCGLRHGILFYLARCSDAEKYGPGHWSLSCDALMPIP